VGYIGNSTALLDWIATYPNTTTHGLVFYSFAPTNMAYTILFNASVSAQNLYDVRRKPDGRNELQISVDKALLRLQLGKEVFVNASYKPFPQLGYQTGQSVTAQYGTVFYFSGIMFQYVLILYNVCMEKDLLLRRGLRVIGLKDWVYWISWLISALVITVLAVVVLLASGYASRLEFFTNTSVSVVFVVFLLYSASIISLAFFTSVFIQKAKSSLNIGMGVFVLGLLFVSIVGNTYTQQAIYDDDLVTRAVPIAFQFIPPFNLAKAMADINDAASTFDTNGIPKNVTNYTWDKLYEPGCIPKNENGEIYCKEMPATIYALYFLIMNFLLYGILTWYFDQIYPGVHGEPRPFYFLFTPSYWGFKTKKPDVRKSIYMNGINADNEENEDKDVAAERNQVRSADPDQIPVRIAGLRKVFKSYSLKSLLCKCRAASEFEAVKGLNLGVHHSHLLALLGHNGAGKTTTISMMTGLLSPTSGGCYLYGKDIFEDMDEISEIIGYCPQHDILWNDLTAREHMEIFCELKGIPEKEITSLINDRLEDVQLFSVSDHCVGTFSGGMKRRLSVTLSFIGDPKVVFLDEPTTGMDPYVRRDVWNLILRLKKGRAVIMTTHSMEEADVLGDKIAIMALGNLMAVGTSTHLKNRYAGYNLVTMVPNDNSENIKQMVNSELPGSIFERENVVEGTAYLRFRLPPTLTSRLGDFLEKLEESKQANLVTDFSFSKTTLEEVFLNVTSATEYLESTKKE